MGNNGQKIGVTAPARKNMLMQMIGYTRSPNFALIHADRNLRYGVITAARSE